MLIRFLLGGEESLGWDSSRRFDYNGTGPNYRACANMNPLTHDSARTFTGIAEAMADQWG